MPTEIVRFPNRQGVKLAGRLEVPSTKPRAWAIFAHCFACSKDSLAAVRISRALAEQGIGVLRFDFAGIGESEGDFGESHFSANVTDILSAADWLEEHHRAPKLLMGHSLGGAAALAAAGDIDSLRAVVTIAAPSEPSHVRHAFAAHEKQIQDEGSAQVQIGPTELRITREFLSDLEAASLDDKVRTLRRALLIMHSPTDPVVEVHHARHLFEIARHPKSYVSLDEMDHLLTDTEDAGYVAKVIYAWVSRYVSG